MKSNNVSYISQVLLSDADLQGSKLSCGGGTELQCLLQCLAHTMNHEGLASWDHRKTFDKQAPECFCSQQAILTFAVRGRHASRQITHHSSQYSLCSFLSVYAEVSRSSYHMVQEVGFQIPSVKYTDLLNARAQCIDVLCFSGVQDTERNTGYRATQD